MTGEYTQSVRGSHALRTRGRANAKGYYQAIFIDVKQADLEFHNPDFSEKGGDFDVWTRSIFNTLFKNGVIGGESWAFPNYQVAPNGDHGAYIVLGESQSG